MKPPPSKQYIELWLEMTLPETNSQFAPENGWFEHEISFPIWVLTYFHGRAVSSREGILMYYNCYLVNSLDPSIAAIKVEHFLVG